MNDVVVDDEATDEESGSLLRLLTMDDAFEVARAVRDSVLAEVDERIAGLERRIEATIERFTTLLKTIRLQVETPAPEIQINIPKLEQPDIHIELPKPTRLRKSIEYDDYGRPTHIVEEREDVPEHNPDQGAPAGHHEPYKSNAILIVSLVST
jgi:hypothetical protein